METYTNMIFKGFLLTATVATLYAYDGLSDDRAATEENYHLTRTDESKSWEEYPKDYYQIEHAEMQASNQRRILNKFASNLLENSVSMDPSISKIINENFSKMLSLYK
jgi:hypothetical protein